MIKLIDLTKVYRKFKAVDGLNLDVPQGQVFGFLGPNGAGKTTTIRMMAGVLKPTSGRVELNGYDLATRPSEAKRTVGFIPDRPYLYEKLTGMEFLRFIAGLYRLDHDLSPDRRALELLDLFELTDWRDELIESYSHGMKQRLVMCSALLHAPKVIVVDEPMVGLDPRAARLVKDIFRNQAKNGTTVFMSTHSLGVAQEVCEEIAIIQAGRIIARGTADELRALAGVDGNLENTFLKLTEETSSTHEGPGSPA
ncbi:MAG: ABC transporter ATP-binding protein [Desulfobacteraceae bacterium]|jgi:ABC-2 type transport system ATP-binding protein